MDAATFDWWFDRNPEGSLRSLAVIDGAVVGAAAHSLTRLVLAGEERIGQHSVHAVTAERARGLGIFRALEQHHEQLGLERGSSCALVFANELTRPLFLGPLGWQQIDRRRVWGRPLRGALVRRLRRSGGASDTGSARQAGQRGVRALERFGPAQEQAYRSQAGAYGNHIVRDARYLQWRYLDSPRGYAAYATRSGFAVLGHVRRGRVSAGLVMDAVAPPDEARALLRRCVREARRCDVLFALPTPSLPRSLLARCGFVPLPITFDFLGFGLAHALDARPAAWTVSLGDTDFF